MRISRWRLLAIPLLPVFVAMGCGSDNGDEGGSGDTTPTSGGDTTPTSGEIPDGPTIRLVPQDFGESRTLTEVYGQYLEAKGYDVDIQDASGFRDIVYPALQEDKADIVIDYTGSGASFVDETGTPSPDPDETYARLQAAVEGEDYQALEYSPAEDKNALVVLKTFADENSLTQISDLKAIEDQVVFGGSAQCIERPDCLLGYQSPDFYDLQFKEVRTIDYGPPLAAGLEEGALQAVQYQTTAPEIETGDFVILEDDKGMLSADNIVPLVRTALLDEYGDDLTTAINELSAMLTTEDLIGWNSATDIDKEEPADVAEAWLEDKGLL